MYFGFSSTWKKNVLYNKALGSPWFSTRHGWDEGTSTGEAGCLDQKGLWPLLRGLFLIANDYRLAMGSVILQEMSSRYVW